MSERRLKILLCLYSDASREMGGSKIRIELAEELEKLGWECSLLTPENIREISPNHRAPLLAWLMKYGSPFDVIEVEHGSLPTGRSHLPPHPLLVGRVSLLIHHYRNIQLPRIKTWKEYFREMVRPTITSSWVLKNLNRAEKTLHACDLINVANPSDRDLLIQYGHPAEKIAVIPYGMDARRMPFFEKVRTDVPQTPCIAFLGSFDVRKGAAELPDIIETVSRTIPNVRFRLLGTKGAYATEAAVRRALPTRRQSQVQIVPTFSSDDLPALLSDCSLGIFPSYIESFGFAVLEMLAAKLPVIAYDSPGPNSILPKEWLVRQGNYRAMANKAAALLSDPEILSAARQEADAAWRKFTWKRAAKMTDEIYREYLARREGSR